MSSSDQPSELSPLVTRLHRDVIDRVRAEATPTADAERYLALADAYAASAAREQAALADVQLSHARAQSQDDRRDVVIAALRSQEAPSRALRAARRGWLDLDAFAERQERAAHDHHAAEAIALRLAAARATEACATTLTNALAARLVKRAPAPLRCAAAEAIAVVWDHVASQRDGIRAVAWPALVQALQRDSGVPRRVQAAAAGAAWHLDRDASTSLFATRLRTRATAEDDFVVRQHLVKLLGRSGRSAAVFEVLRDLHVGGEPSEHVRIALCDALFRAGGADAVPVLTQIAATADREPSPRVRAIAVATLGALARDRVDGALAAIMARLDDGEVVISRVASEELAALAAHGMVSAAEARTLATVASACASRATTAADADRALDVLEAIAPQLAASVEQTRSLVASLREIAPDTTATVRTDADPTTFGRALALAARDGFGLYARVVRGGYRVRHGARFVTRMWRILHEARSPTPYKRHDELHTMGRSYPGTLRAHSKLLAEATPTIPGEPLEAADDGGWGVHLPTVDDLLSMGVWSSREVALHSSRGITRIASPARLVTRIAARRRLTLDYAELAASRNRALSPLDPAERTAYIVRLRALGFVVSFEPYSTPGIELAAPPSVAAAFGGGAASLALFPIAIPDRFDELVQYSVSPSGNTLGQLGLAVAVVGAGLLAGNLIRRELIRRDRAAIPLVIGGWGTRGKSGTERLKAALFHGLGAEVLVKTTGCEAMFIHGIPGRRPTEIFIHRSYDKATIWEQRDLLHLAARLGAEVFLWECMALSPPLVTTLQDEWMQDDLSTLTNAYPDHEDIQGPAGRDVARVIAGFIRTRGTVITSEEQMLPVLRREAERKQARLIPVGWRGHALLAEDLLARFPYNEHPRNIALVRRLARELGIDEDLATADMADHVIPDLGVLKTYPEAQHRGRRLTFINGMSANERTGFLSNWQRMGCERAVTDSTERGRWTVTVVNNRFDRVARSKVFAEILVRDATADRHVLIGTNLTGLVKYTEAALEQFLDELRLFRDEDAPDERATTVADRLARVRHRLRVGPATTDAVLGELGAWVAKDASALRPEVDAALATAATSASQTTDLEPVIAALAATSLPEIVGGVVPDAFGDERVRHAVRSIARRALLDSVAKAAERALDDPGARAEVDRRLRAIYRALFVEMLVPLPDAGATGDQVIDFIAGACPPGTTVTLMGIQNIKGTGLDFVYRFLRLDEVTALVKRLRHGDPDNTRAAAAELAARADWGILDAPIAVDAVRAAADRAEPTQRDYLSAIAAQLEAIARDRLAALTTQVGARGTWLRRGVEKAFDAVDAVRRRRHADAILDALVHREISHERAALEARRLVDREKKGWFRKK